MSVASCAPLLRYSESKDGCEVVSSILVTGGDRRMTDNKEAYFLVLFFFLIPSLWLESLKTAMSYDSGTEKVSEKSSQGYWLPGPCHKSWIHNGVFFFFSAF